LQTGDEIAINEKEPMSGMDLLKLPIVLETYRVLDRPPTLTQRQYISETLGATQDNTSANELLKIVAGQDDPYLGAEIVTGAMQRLGLANTYITIPYDEEDLRPGEGKLDTPANSAEDLRTAPTPHIQTTAEDMGTLLSMLYYCAEGLGGAFTAVYDNDITPDECQTIIAFMVQNRIDSLIEGGVPPGTPVAHRHGWIADTHADAGIVYSPGGDYVIVEFLYKPDWLEWELSSPLMANMSRAIYNFYNFDQPYLGN